MICPRDASFGEINKPNKRKPHFRRVKIVGSAVFLFLPRQSDLHLGSFFGSAGAISGEDHRELVGGDAHAVIGDQKNDVFVLLPACEGNGTGLGWLFQDSVENGIFHGGLAYAGSDFPNLISGIGKQTLGLFHPVFGQILVQGLSCFIFKYSLSE